MTTQTIERPLSNELDTVRALQRLAYQGVEEVAATLEPGVTERDAADRMTAWFTAHGVDDYFHRPFAWFGERTALRWKNPRRFAPTGKRLAEGMPYILDVAPLFDGWVADIGYARCLGDNAVHAQLVADLEAHRALVLERVRAREPLNEIYHAVARLAARQGYEVRHKAYPGEVIAHRVDKLTGRIAAMRPRFVMGLSVKALLSLGQGIVTGKHPLWNGSRSSHHPATPGLWAVEPHLAFRDVGAKFEELLVVGEDDAYWLDDDLPHVRRWRTDAQAVRA